MRVLVTKESSYQGNALVKVKDNLCEEKPKVGKAEKARGGVQKDGGQYEDGEGERKQGERDGAGG
eukprot:2326762-Pleurochrysis_carterae.AAC.1